ncbi:MAG: endonuclease MutS2 [Candidatus Velthaea sp.]
MSSLVDQRGLEVIDFARIRERLAGQTHAARAFARASTLEPSMDFAEVQRLVAETGEMRELVRVSGFGLARIADIDEAVATAALGVPIPAADLRAVGDALGAAAAAARAVRDAENTPLLRERIVNFRVLPTIASRIFDAIDERGIVLDRASPALGRIRRGIAQAQDDARDRAAALLRSAKYARAIQDHIVTVRDGRYVVPIKAEFAGEVPGIVHDASASGSTLFVEPLEALETNNRLRALRMQEEHEVARILAELSTLVGGEAAQIDLNVGLYVELDLSFARAAVAERMNAVAPMLVDEAVVDVHEGRHPLLDDRAVPQSLRLDEQTRLLLISGPNMGGKTVALKMVGLFVTMAACGMHVPAVEATLGRFERIFTDIGDEQSIAQNASTFSAHLRRLAEILAGANDRALILIDEIGAGTEPNAGAALAVATLERFLTAGARVIATTPATELKLFGAEHAHVRNASVRFDPHTYAPTYQLDIGSPGQSLAFALARTLNVDPAVVARAETLLSSAERDYDRALAELAEERTRTTHEREALDRERQHLRALEENARKRAEALERERRELAGRAEARLGEALRGFTLELERRAAQNGGGRGRARVTPGQSDLLSRTIDDMRRDLGIDRTPARSGTAPAPIGVGDRVIVTSLDQEGVVAEDLGQNALVSIGSMRMLVPKSELQRRSGAPPPKKQRPSSATALEAASRAQTELDVRGKRFVEAEPEVDRWIDEAVLLGFSPLRLIHGKGTGLLGRGLQEYLKTHPSVTGVRFGHPDEGGSGVTVFEIR